MEHLVLMERTQGIAISMLLLFRTVILYSAAGTAASQHASE
jgi:hypothetical protein